MINGLFNQICAAVRPDPVQVLAPALLFGSTSLTLMFSSLMVSTATIILGGIPAAIYERAIGAKDDSTDGLAVDMACRHRASSRFPPSATSSDRAVSRSGDCRRMSRRELALSVAPAAGILTAAIRRLRREDQ